MITIRPAKARGHANHGWLDTYHTFSFADYFDRDHMHFRSLRVINEDRIAGKAGFPPHPHRDMEIITWILSGALAHKDSMGNGSTIRPGDVQRMTAGTGVTHSEFNAVDTETHLLQIWIIPEARDLEPGYEETHIPAEARRGQLKLVATRNPTNGEVRVHQDVDLYTALLEPGETVTHTLAEGRGAWLQVAKGALILNGQALQQGDGAAIEETPRLEITATESAELLLFDLG